TPGKKSLPTGVAGAGRHNFKVLLFRSQKLRGLDQFGFLDREFEACASRHETGGFAAGLISYGYSNNHLASAGGHGKSEGEQPAHLTLIDPKLLIYHCHGEPIWRWPFGFSHNQSFHGL